MSQFPASSAGIKRGRALATPAGEILFGMKSSPGKRKITVFHRTSVLRRNTGVPQKEPAWHEKTSDRGWQAEVFSERQNPMQAALDYGATDSRKMGCPNLYPRVS